MNLLVILATSVSSLLCADYNTNAQPSQNKDAQSCLTALQAEPANPCNEGDDEDPQPIMVGIVSYNSLLSIPVPIYHACVELKTTSGTSITITGTNINGHYYFNSITSGTYDLVFSAPGFTTQTIRVTISGTPQTMNVTMY